MRTLATLDEYIQSYTPHLSPVSSAVSASTGGFLYAGANKPDSWTPLGCSLHQIEKWPQMIVLSLGRNDMAKVVA